MKRLFLYLFFLLPALPATLSAQTCTAEAGPDATLTCIITSVQLDGVGSSTGPGIVYQWSSPDGGAITGGETTLTPTVSTPGTYCLLVTDTNDGCTATDCVLVNQDTDSPLADAGPGAVLNCQQTQVTLSGAGSTGPAFTYIWSTVGGGNIVSGSTTLTPTLNSPGIYCLEVTNTANGCQSSDCTTVTANVAFPVVDAGPALTLTCSQTAVVLQATSSGGPNIVIIWTGPGITPQNQLLLNPIVTVPGQYCVVATNTTNGCTAMDCTVVQIDATFPGVSLATPPPITCLAPQATLQTTVVGAPVVDYDWSGPGINAGNVDQEDPTVLLPGTYCVTVTNLTNGCTTSACAQVTTNFTPPTLSVSAGTIDCAQPTATLTATTNAVSPTFQWTGPGNVVVGTGASVVVDVAGDYFVTVTDASGCSATATATVTADGPLPAVDATVTPYICGTPGGSIGLTPNPATQTLEYAWSNSASTPDVQGLAAGHYFVTITDTQTGCSVVRYYEIVTQPLNFTVITGNISCFGAQNGSFDLEVLDGTPPYTYQWDGPASFSSSVEDPTGLGAGVYFLTVSDAMGCSGAGGPFIIASPSPLTLPAPQVTPDCGSGGTITLPGASGGTPPYSYNWSNAQSGNALTGLAAGTYIVTVTDANNCLQILTVAVPMGEPALVTAEVFDFACDGQGSVVLTPVSPTAVLSYAWSDGSTLPVLIAGQPGNYSVTVTNDNSGCTAVYSFTLQASNAPCATIKGRVVRDLSENCAADAGEPGLANWIVRANGAPNFYAVTDTAGYFSMEVVPGVYAVEAIVPNGQWISCGVVAAAPLTVDDTVSVQLPVKAETFCPAMTVDITTPQLRRCFSSNFYIVNYCNQGVVSALNAYAIVTLDPFLSLNVANAPFVSLGNQQYRFELGTVNPGGCGSIWIQVTVSCNAVLGQTHCSEVQIYPDSLCAPDPDWSGASLRVFPSCDGDSVRFAIKNVGVAPMSTALDYIVIEDGIMLMQSGGPGLGAGDSIRIAVPANGATWRVEALQEPFHPEGFSPVATVEGCTTTGSFTTGFALQFPNAGAGPGYDIDCHANIGSFDPNDKQGLPLGYGESRYVKPGTELEYLIRFQNTGTDTAFTVVIRDTLSAWLDPATIRPGASSHAYQFDLTGEGIASFAFENILLPDSFVNEAASHGFVSFRISPKTETPLETDIFNRAAIYFDFNDPILTNTTTHRIGDYFLLIGTSTPVRDGLHVGILPNPVRGEATVEIADWPAGRQARVAVFNGTGRLVREETIAGPKFGLRVDGLPGGLYFLRVSAADGRTGVGRFVVKN